MVSLVVNCNFNVGQTVIFLKIFAGWVEKKKQAKYMRGTPPPYCIKTQQHRDSIESNGIKAVVA